jgi:hypothetical protein
VSLRNTAKKLYLISIHEICALTNLAVHKEFLSRDISNQAWKGKKRKAKNPQEKGARWQAIAECFPRSAAGTQGIVCPHVIMPMGNAVAEK